MQKTLFITVSESSVVRNYLRSDFLQEVLSSSQVRVVLVAPATKVEEYRRAFGSGRVLIEPLPPPQVSRGEKLLAFLARSGFVSGTQIIVQHRTYVQGESALPSLPKQILALLLGAFPWARALLRRLELTIKPSEPLARLFETYKPDLVCSTVLLDEPVDVPVMREATRRAVPTVGLLRGWDNLTTYGLVRILPSRMVVYNDFMREKAIELHGMRPQDVAVVGTPAFDADAHPERALSREAYCDALGIDPSKKIILYAAIGDYLFPKEGEIAAVFERLIEQDELPKDSVVVFRAHPAFTSPLERMRGMKYVVPERTPEPLNALCHAAVVVTAASSMMIEGAMLDKPIITVAFDGLSREPYWFSIARFHDTAVHILALLKMGGVRVVHSPLELAAAVREALGSPGLRAEGRARIVERFAGPNRGHAAKALGELVRTMLVS